MALQLAFNWLLREVIDLSHDGSTLGRISPGELEEPHSLGTGAKEHQDNDAPLLKWLLLMADISQGLFLGKYAVSYPAEWNK